MNKLALAKRVQIPSMLCEGSSMRSITRVADVSINTVYKLLWHRQLGMCRLTESAMG
jgi:transposase-like protein